MSSANVFHATDKDFDDLVLKSDQPVLVDFWAPWCGPCKMIAPSLDQLADTYEGKAKVVKVDIEANPQLGMRFNVRSIPMLVVFKGGQVASTQIVTAGLFCCAASAAVFSGDFPNSRACAGSSVHRAMQMTSRARFIRDNPAA